MLESVPTMPDGRPGFGPIALQPAPMAVAVEGVQTAQGPALAFTMYFANGQITGLFEPESLDEIADDIKAKVKSLTTGLVVPTPQKKGSLILP